MGLFSKSEDKVSQLQAQLPDDISVRFHDRAKRLNLRAVTGKKDYRFVLTLPKRTSLRQALDFVEKQHIWLHRLRIKTPEPQLLSAGTRISLLGQEVEILYGGDFPRKRTKLEDNHLTVYGDEALIAKRVIRFLKKHAETIFKDKVAYFTEEAGCEISKIRVTDTKSRWGSCTSDGVISLSWRLLLAPEMVCDYVIAHEISHRFHMDHSPAFWHFCENLFPETKKAKKWLKTNGHTLHLWQG